VVANVLYFTASWRPERSSSMSIITVVDEDYISGREFTEKLATTLGYRLVDAAALVEQAAARGGDQDKLHRVCGREPHFFDRFFRSKCTQVLQLQAALARCIQEGSVVCHGIATDLLNIKARHIYSISVEFSTDSRLLWVQNAMGLSAAEASKYLRKSDIRRDRWRKYLYGTGAKMQHESNLMFNLDETGVDQACLVVRDTVRRHALLQPTDADLGIIENWALCTAIKAALAEYPGTQHLDLDVTTESDSVVLRGIVSLTDETAFPLRFPTSMTREIQAALAHNPETKNLDTNLTIMGDALVLRGIAHRTAEMVGPLQVPAGTVTRESHTQAGSWSHMTRFLIGKRPIERLGLRLRPISEARFLLHPAGVAVVAGVVVISAMIFASLWRAEKSQQPSAPLLQSYLGVITDSSCGPLHKGELPSADCVRSCVRSGGAKYALNEGDQDYVISDQQAAERFAAQKVMVTGVWDMKSRELHIASIQATGP
jgi:cytidylate kinase-like protein